MSSGERRETRDEWREANDERRTPISVPEALPEHLLRVARLFKSAPQERIVGAVTVLVTTDGIESEALCDGPLGKILMMGALMSTVTSLERDAMPQRAKNPETSLLGAIFGR